MTNKLPAFSIILILTSLMTFSAAAQINTDLQDRLDDRPDTERIDVIIQTTGQTEQAVEAVRGLGGEVNAQYSIIDGVAVTIPATAVENLADRDFVERIDPDYEMETALDVSTSQIEAEETWSHSNGSGTQVAVLDTGISSHPALDVSGEVDFTGEGTGDGHGHGTHVAGIVASQDENYRGIAAEASLFNVKVLDSEGTGSASDVISGVEWAVENDIEVMVLSLGAPVEECDGEDAVSSALENAYALGTLPVVSAGNEGPESETITLPGCAEDAVTVGSVGSDNEASSFSSRGPTADGRVKPNIVAPGEGITSTWNDGGFQSSSGTSMSAPHVSGAAALLLTGNESLTTAELKQTFMDTSDDLGLDENTQGSGLINVKQAYDAVTSENDTEVNETENFPPVIEEASPVDEVVNDTVEGAGIDVELSARVTDNDSETINVTFSFANDTEIQSFSGEPPLEPVHMLEGLPENNSYEWKIEALDEEHIIVTEDLPFRTASEDVVDGNESEGVNDSELPPGLQDREQLPPAFTERTPAEPRGIGYGLRRAFERVDLALTFNEERKAEKRVELAERRLAEASTLEEGDERRERLMQEYRDNVEQARQVADRNNESERSRGISERIRGLEQAERQLSQNPGQGTPGGPEEPGRSGEQETGPQNDVAPGGPDISQNERPGQERSEQRTEQSQRSDNVGERGQSDQRASDEEQRSGSDQASGNEQSEGRQSEEASSGDGGSGSEAGQSSGSSGEASDEASSEQGAATGQSQDDSSDAGADADASESGTSASEQESGPEGQQPGQNSDQASQDGSSSNSGNQGSSGGQSGSSDSGSPGQGGGPVGNFFASFGFN